MKPAELARARGELVAFAAEMLDSLPRSDQRRWGETYLRGLMLDGRRKSIEPMAALIAARQRAEHLRGEGDQLAARPGQAPPAS